MWSTWTARRNWPSTFWPRMASSSGAMPNTQSLWPGILDRYQHTNKHPVTHVHLLDVLDTLSSSLKQVSPAQKTAETRMTLKHMKQKYLVRNISHLCESHKNPDENTSKSVSFQYHYSTIIEFSHILHEFYLYIFCLDLNYILMFCISDLV